VDPKGDTPAAMTAYGKRFQADPARWHFLTGSVEALDALCDKAFHLGRIDGENFEHSTRFVLVDRQARIRGYYDSSEPESIRTLLGDLRSLAAAPAAQAGISTPR
jgi:protein SCO1/2